MAEESAPSQPPPPRPVRSTYRDYVTTSERMAGYVVVIVALFVVGLSNGGGFGSPEVLGSMSFALLISWAVAQFFYDKGEAGRHKAFLIVLSLVALLSLAALAGT